MDDLTNVNVNNTPTKFPRFAKHMKDNDPVQLASLPAADQAFYNHVYNFSALPDAPTLLVGIDGSREEVCTLTVTAAVASEYAVKTLEVLTGSDAVLEIQSFTVTAACSSSGDVTIDGDTVAVLDTDDAEAVATKIRAASLTNWTTSGTGIEVILTAKVYGAIGAITAAPGTTGVTFSAVSIDAAGTDTAGNVTITLEGPGAVTIAIANGDSIATVVAAIAGGTYTGWTASNDGDIVSFTCDTYGPKTGSFVDTDSTGVTATSGDLVDDNVGVDASGNVTVTLSGTGYVVALAIDDDTVDKVATKIRAGSFGTWIASGATDEVIFTAAADGDETPDISFTDTGVTGATADVAVDPQGFIGPSVTWTDVGSESDTYSVFYITGAAGSEVLADILAGTEFTGTKSAAGTEITTIGTTKVGVVVAGVSELGIGEYAGPIFVDIA